MAEDRMLNDEILLGLIKANSGGGGGGTTNYNQLENKPQIAGTTLSGNKSLADLGIASAQDVKKEFIGTLAEWNALTTAQQKEYDTYQITDDYSEALMPNYSTTEQKTGQKWIDGKDIYVITKANVTPETVIATNVDKVINCVIARHGGSADSSQIKFVGDGFIQPDSSGINLENGTASYVTWSGSGNVLDRTAEHVILYYTKTT